MNLDSLIKEATCPNCRKMLSDPRSLPCGNSVCFNCLDDLNDLLCICNSDHEIPENGFPKTIQLGKICEFLKTLKAKEKIKQEIETLIKETQTINIMSWDFLERGKITILKK